MRDVLVPRHGQIVDAVDVPPSERVREVIVLDLLVELVVRALGRGVAAPDEAGGLDLVLLPDLRWRILARRAFAAARSFGYVGRRAYLSGVPSGAVSRRWRMGRLGARARDQRALSQFFGSEV